MARLFGGVMTSIFVFLFSLFLSYKQGHIIGGTKLILEPQFSKGFEACFLPGRRWERARADRPLAIFIANGRVFWKVEELMCV